MTPDLIAILDFLRAKRESSATIAAGYRKASAGSHYHEIAADCESDAALYQAAIERIEAQCALNGLCHYAAVKEAGHAS